MVPIFTLAALSYCQKAYDTINIFFWMVHDFFWHGAYAHSRLVLFFYISQMDLSFFLFRWIVNCLFRLKTERKRRKQSFIMPFSDIFPIYKSIPRWLHKINTFLIKFVSFRFVSYCWSVSYSSSQFFIHKNCLIEN